jgi:hypothetical protein
MEKGDEGNESTNQLPDSSRSRNRGFAVNRRKISLKLIARASSGGKILSGFYNTCIRATHTMHQFNVEYR